MSVQIRVLRGCVCSGAHLAAGSVTALDELEACALIDAGKAVLVDEGDAAMLRTFRLAQQRKTLRDLGPLPAPPGSPWQEWRR